MNPRVVIRVNAGVILAIGLALLVPLALSVLYRDGSWASFLLPAALMVATGIVSFRLSRPRGRAPRVRVEQGRIGGCAGSTAGGIKVIRILIIFRTILQDVFRMIHP
ncbi:MAG: hypothetical protein M3Y38_07250, partial [Actinomycetota bacterium]|nr:hypothetical protein [Actinomycetota bacterium]